MINASRTDATAVPMNVARPPVKAVPPRTAAVILINA